MAKIYELTTDWKDGYRKFYVTGVSNDTNARKLAKRGFGKYYWKNGISYYDTTEDAKKRGRSKYWGSRTQFLRRTRNLRKS